MLLEISSEKPDVEIDASIEYVKKIAVERLRFPFSENECYPESDTLGIGILRPEHLGFSNDYWQGSFTTSKSEWFNYNLPQDVFLIITGIFDLSCGMETISEVIFNAKGGKFPINNIEQLYSFKDQMGWFQEPLIIGPMENITMKVSAFGNSTRRLGLMGYAIGKRARLIDIAATQIFTLTVTISGLANGPAVNATINGEAMTFTAYVYTKDFPEAHYTIIMPSLAGYGYPWFKWENETGWTTDGSNLTRTINLDRNMNLIAYYGGPA